MLREHGTITTGMQKVLDIVITASSFIAAYYIKRNLPGGWDNLSIEPNYYVVLLMIIITWYISFQWTGIYISYRISTFLDFLLIIIKSVFLGLVLLNIGLYVIHLQDISRLLMGIFLALNIFLLTLYKFIVFITLRKLRARGVNTRNLLIVGSKERAIDLIRSVENHRGTGYKILGCFDLDADIIGNTVVNGHRVIGSMGGLEQYLMDNVVDELVFAMPLRLIVYADRYLSMAESMGVKVRIIPDWQIHYLMYQPGIAHIQFENFLGVSTMALQTTPQNEGKLFVKTLIDYGAGLVFIVLSLPLFIVISVAIKLISKGTVFYKQERLGLNGRRFMVYKFRTMVNNADELQKELIEMNEADGPVFKIKNDPRIIPWVGVFLRKTGLDELPQLLNVLRGEMSLVGPRPPIPSEVGEYSIWQRRRLSMKPGLTCIWQIAPRRNDLSFDDWMKMDLEYIDTWSLFNDFKLLVLTAKAVLMGSGR
ncbi:MAG: sugar transferase [Desulfobacteraceae bacterium]|nr:sugar transferase [Desulfobacteraceae bacterium]